DAHQARVGCGPEDGGGVPAHAEGGVDVDRPGLLQRGGEEPHRGLQEDGQVPVLGGSLAVRLVHLAPPLGRCCRAVCDGAGPAARTVPRPVRGAVVPDSPSFPTRHRGSCVGAGTTRGLTGRGVLRAVLRTGRGSPPRRSPRSPPPSARGRSPTPGATRSRGGPERR